MQTAFQVAFVLVVSGLFHQLQAFVFADGFAVFTAVVRFGLGRGARFVGSDVEIHAFAGFAGIEGADVADRNPNLVRHPTEAGSEADPVVIDVQAGAGGSADVEDDLVVFHKLHGHAGVLVYPDLDVGCVALVVAPFVQGADEVGFEGGVHGQDSCVAKGYLKNISLKYFTSYRVGSLLGMKKTITAKSRLFRQRGCSSQTHGLYA